MPNGIQLFVAGVHDELATFVIARCRGQRTHDSDLISQSAQLFELVGDLHPGNFVAAAFGLTLLITTASFDIERIQMAHRAIHIQIDDALRFAGIDWRGLARPKPEAMPTDAAPGLHS